MPRLTLILVFALLVATLPLGSRAAEEPFEIDVSLPITGQVAFLGANTAKGVRALEGFINEHGGIRVGPSSSTFPTTSPIRRSKCKS